MGNSCCGKQLKVLNKRFLILATFKFEFQTEKVRFYSWRVAAAILLKKRLHCTCFPSQPINGFVHHVGCYLNRLLSVYDDLLKIVFAENYNLLWMGTQVLFILFLFHAGTRSNNVKSIWRKSWPMEYWHYNLSMFDRKSAVSCK